MATDKKTVRSYRVSESTYKKANKRARKDGSTLAAIIENVVVAYARGLDIKAVKSYPGGGHAIDIFTEDFSIKLDKIMVK